MEVLTRSMVSKKSVTPDVTAAPKQNAVKLPQYNYEEIAQDPYKHVITFIEKKIRNMDKRKGKLEGYKRIKREGGSLDPDQEIAMKKYEEVAGSLDFAKELVKIFSVVSEEVTKVNLRVEEHRIISNDENDLKTSQFVTKALYIFQLISSDEGIRQELMKGEDGINEEDLNLLVNFYEEHLDVSFKAGDNAASLMDSVGEHLHLMKQNSSKEVIGTTYASLNNSYLEVCANECFTNYPDLDALNPACEEAEEIKDEDETISSPANEDYQNCVEDDKPEQDLDTDDVQAEEVDDAAPEELEEEDDDEESAEIITKEFVASQEPRALVEETPTPEPAADTPEPALPVEESKPVKKSIHEVLAEVQGKYSFLQDSMIDFEVGAPAATPSSLPTAGLSLQNHVAPVTANEIISSSNAPTQSFDNGTVEATFTPAHLTSNSHQAPSMYAPLTSSDTSLSVQQAPSDNLGMGQTTFGGNNTHTLYNTEAISLAKSIPENVFASNYHQNLHQSQTQSFDTSTEEALSVQMQMAAVGVTATSSSLPSMTVPDPPKSHIPLPNEEVSYKAYLPTDSANDTSNMQYGMIGGADSPQLANPAESVLSSANARISPESGGYAMESAARSDGLPNPADEMMPSDDVRSEPVKLEPSADDIDHRMNGNRYQNTNGFNNKRAQSYNNGGNGYYSRGGGYRQSNNQRGYYDNNMSNHRNFSNSGNNYNQYNTHYNNRQENGAYGGNMRRNNNGNRGNRGNNSRGNNTRPGSYNRSRTFRPQHQTEQGGY